MEIIFSTESQNWDPDFEALSPVSRRHVTEDQLCVPLVGRPGGHFPERGSLSGFPKGAFADQVRGYLLWVVQADPYGQGSLVATYVLCYDVGFL